MKVFAGRGLLWSIALLLATFAPGALSADKANQSEKLNEKRLLLAKVWDPSIDPTGWWISEKYDGMRAHWDGKRLWSRGGNEIHAPEYFLSELPSGVELDGELWLGRGKFEETVGTVRRNTPNERWRQMKYMVFDAPKAKGNFEQRMDFLRRTLPPAGKHAKPVPQTLCLGVDDLIIRRDRIVAVGGEGLMIRKPESEYEPGPSRSLLKVKPHSDAEAEVIAHKPGKGKHEGKMGSIRVKTSAGREFSIGTGFSNEERESPPAIGTIVTYRYRGFTKNGLPRFPSFLPIRKD